MKENAELLNSLVAQFQSMDREQKHQRKQRLEAVSAAFSYQIDQKY